MSESRLAPRLPWRSSTIAAKDGRCAVAIGPIAGVSGRIHAFMYEPWEPNCEHSPLLTVGARQAHSWPAGQPTGHRGQRAAPDGFAWRRTFVFRLQDSHGWQKEKRECVERKELTQDSERKKYFSLRNGRRIPYSYPNYWLKFRVQRSSIRTQILRMLCFDVSTPIIQDEWNIIYHNRCQMSYTHNKGVNINIVCIGTNGNFSYAEILSIFSTVNEYTYIGYKSYKLTSREIHNKNEFDSIFASHLVHCAILWLSSAIRIDVLNIFQGAKGTIVERCELYRLHPQRIGAQAGQAIYGKCK